MEPLPESTPENSFNSIIRFIIGAIVGLSAAGLYWGTSAYFDYYVSLDIGIVGCILLAIFCGTITMKWGYKAVETLLENLR
ncbi:MAG: hypothetical protein HC903_14295 [Methylacidiphilales bacterium]|nr:hypothetical protein [Candidatus Methylacidiphilales bacterium]